MHSSSTKNHKIYISHIISIDIPTVDRNFFLPNMKSATVN